MKFHPLNLLKILGLVFLSSVVTTTLGYFVGIPTGSDFYMVAGIVTGIILGFYGPQFITFNKENPNGRNDTK